MSNLGYLDWIMNSGIPRSLALVIQIMPGWQHLLRSLPAAELDFQQQREGQDNGTKSHAMRLYSDSMERTDFNAYCPHLPRILYEAEGAVAAFIVIPVGTAALVFWALVTRKSYITVYKTTLAFLTFRRVRERSKGEQRGRG
jgi:hypothetical protein